MNRESADGVAFQHCPATGRAPPGAALEGVLDVSAADDAAEPLVALVDSVEDDGAAELQADSAAADATASIAPQSHWRLRGGT